MEIKSVLKIGNTLLVLIIIAITSCSNDIEPPEAKPNDNEPVDTLAYRGMDLSFQPEIEDWNTPYFDANGETIDFLPWLAGKGVNLVRLKLWHTPENEYNTLTSVAAYASRVKAAGMDFLLDIHYSDTWADPGKQFIPAAWEGLTAEVMADSVYQYTLQVMTYLVNHDASPEIVQIGNETNSGFLWDTGRVGGTFDSNWPVYINLVKEGIKAVKEVSSGTKIMFHFAGTDGADWFFGELIDGGVSFNLIGLSYYSIWHGQNLTTLENNLMSLANAYNKPIMIVETAYPFTLEWNDWTNNLYGDESQLIPGIAATPDGQLQFMDQLQTIIESLGTNGAGFCYWAPDWVAFKGEEATDGSAWENAATFDFENKALPVMDAFAE